MLGHLTSPGTAWPGSAGWWEVAGPFERCPVPCPALSLSLWSPQLSTLTRPETSTLRGQCSVLAVFNGNLPRPEKSFRGHPWTSGSMLGPQDTAAERQSRAETEWGLSTSRGGEGEGGRKRKRGGKERRGEEGRGEEGKRRRVGRDETVSPPVPWEVPSPACGGTQGGCACGVASVPSRGAVGKVRTNPKGQSHQP